jgi:hypothetical protein
MRKPFKYSFLNFFTITVDRVEGKYAVCEFPDEKMRDILLSEFPCKVHDKEHYIVFVDYRGDRHIVQKFNKPRRKPPIPSRLIRF